MPKYIEFEVTEEDVKDVRGHGSADCPVHYALTRKFPYAGLDGFGIRVYSTGIFFSHKSYKNSKNLRRIIEDYDRPPYGRPFPVGRYRAYEV